MGDRRQVKEVSEKFFTGIRCGTRVSSAQARSLSRTRNNSDRGNGLLPSSSRSSQDYVNETGERLDVLNHLVRDSQCVKQKDLILAALVTGDLFAQGFFGL